jgi:hypothetical protein
VFGPILQEKASDERKKLGLPDPPSVDADEEEETIPSDLGKEEEDAQNSPEYWSRYPPD